MEKDDLKRSLRMSDPLSMLNKADKKEFVDHYLTQRDREVYLKRAQDYYEKTFKK